MPLFDVSLITTVLVLLVFFESGYGQSNNPDLMFMVKFPRAVPGCWCVTWQGHDVYYCMCPRYSFGAEFPGGPQPILVTPIPSPGDVKVEGITLFTCRPDLTFVAHRSERAHADGCEARTTPRAARTTTRRRTAATQPPTRPATQSPRRPATPPPTRPPTRALTPPPTRATTRRRTPAPTRAPTFRPIPRPTQAPRRPPMPPPTRSPTPTPPRPASPGLTCSGGYAQLDAHTLCLPTSRLFLGSCGVDQAAILTQHNSYRAGVNPPAANMQKMYWDNELASLAQAWAEQCDVGHDKNRRILGRYIPPAQNFASGHGSMSEAILAFYNEVADFAYGVGSRNGGIIGHYSQVVNDWSSRVGCGCAICNTIYERHYVCNYLGPNWRPKTPYNSGSRCRDCPNNCVDGGLCDCGGKYCDNFSGVNLATCECN